jgi:hypothetical protein
MTDATPTPDQPAGDPAEWPACEHCGHGRPVHRRDCPVVAAGGVR